MQGLKLGGVVEIDADTEILNKEILRKIGRNVILFQQMEHMLKYLAAIGNFSSSASALKSDFEQRFATVNKQTMGNVVKRFVENTFNNADVTTDELTELKEPRIGLKFSIELNDELYNKRKADLASIVAERNDLIHHLLPKWDMNSFESGKKIEHSLDQQRAKILPELDVLKGLIEAIKEHAKFCDSDEVKRQLMLSSLRQSQLVAWFFDLAEHKARPDGWLVFQRTEQFIRQQIPEEFANLEKRFGYKTVKEILLATEFFDIDEEPTKKGGVRLLYRIKPGLNFTETVIILTN